MDLKAIFKKKEKLPKCSAVILAAGSSQRMGQDKTIMSIGGMPVLVRTLLAFEQSEKEVEDLHQRVKEGLETARLNGKQIGIEKGRKLTTKKSVAAKAEIKKFSKDFEGTLDDAAVMKITGLARNTYYKYKKEMKEGQ